MSTNLEAQIQAERVYALCGILRLKSIPYNKKHSVNEAFQVLVEELVRRGRLAWLYAILPVMNMEGIHLGAEDFTPFVLTRLADSFVTNRNKMHFSKTSLGLPVVRVGKIKRVRTLAEILQELSTWSKANNSMNIPQDRQDLLFVPKIIRRIALDLVNRFILEPLFGQITMGLGITPGSGSRPTRVWKMIMALVTKNLAPLSSRASGMIESEETLLHELVNLTAHSLQKRLRMALNEVTVVWWLSDHDGHETVALGHRTCQPEDHICAIKDDKQLLMAARISTTGESTISEATDAQFRGMIFN